MIVYQVFREFPKVETIGTFTEEQMALHFLVEMRRSYKDNNFTIVTAETDDCDEIEDLFR